MNNLAERIAVWRSDQGFHTPNNIDEDAEDMLGKLMLVVTEVAEAAEAVRHKDQENFEEELADTMIRLLDIAGTCGIDIDAAIEEKMEINRQREFRHGKETSL